MFESQSFDVIIDRMLKRIPNDIDKREGSIIWDALAPEALEIARAYCEMDTILNLVFARTTYGHYLDLLCESHGVERKKAKPSVGTAFAEGTAGFMNLAPIEIKVPVKDKILRYIVVDEDNDPTDLELSKSGKSEFKLLCLTPGAIGNIPPNSIEISEYIPGIEKIYNLDPFTSGVDEEDDEALLQRLLEKVRNPPSSGNKKDYERWTKEVPGAKFVKVISLWKGPGTVKLIIFGDKGMPVGQEIVKNVKEHIDPLDGKGEGKAPIGATVTVTTVNVRQVSIEILGLSVKAGYKLDSVKVLIIQNLINYLEEILPGEPIILKSVEAVVTETNGVFDFNLLKIDGKNSNLFTSDEEKIILKEVVFLE